MLSSNYVGETTGTLKLQVGLHLGIITHARSWRHKCNYYSRIFFLQI